MDPIGLSDLTLRLLAEGIAPRFRNASPVSCMQNGWSVRSVARAAFHITAASPSWGSSGVCAVNAKDSRYNIYNELRACKAMTYADEATIPEATLLA